MWEDSGSAGLSAPLAVALGAALVLLTGCPVRYIAPQASESGLTREFNATLDRVWEVAVKALAQKNISIKTIEKASGLIASETITGTIGHEMDCGSIERPLGTERISGRGQGTFNLFVRRITETKTAAQVNSRWNTIYYPWDLYGRVTSATPVECSSTGGVERILLDLIEMGLSE